MGVPLHEIEPVLMARGELFPLEITKRSSLVYHGTSAEFEEDIETQGIRYAPSAVRWEDLMSLVSTFRAMHWRAPTRKGLQFFGGSQSTTIRVAEVPDASRPSLR